MPEVPQQPVADIDGRAGNAAQCQTQRHPRGGQVQPQAGLLQHLRRQGQLAQQGIERQPCIAQVTADVQVVAGKRSRSQQRLRAPGMQRHLTKHRDADIERTGSGVAANEFAVVRISQFQQAFGEGRQPAFINRRQRQRQRKGQGPGCAGRQVAQVDGQRLVAKPGRVGIGKKMPSLHQHVARYGQLGTGSGLQQGAVVADAQRGAAHRAIEIAGNQVKLAHGGAWLIPRSRHSSSARRGPQVLAYPAYRSVPATPA
ncbi:hypothetical protein GALL_544000 [mine drainage metagenome]|uniref:Uncharacterized protein n=1 Tax=mine drainage metagenome TaxID=410659 RepID=A0A1J5PKJ7_9ZZZZ